jgi:hypothetical protein
MEAAGVKSKAWYLEERLKQAFTADGVHLNDPGKALYRGVLTQLLTRPQAVQDFMNSNSGNGFETPILIGQ